MGKKALVLLAVAGIAECRHAELFQILSLQFKYRSGVKNSAQLTEGCVFRRKGLVSVHEPVCACTRFYVPMPSYK